MNIFLPSYNGIQDAKYIGQYNALPNYECNKLVAS